MSPESSRPSTSAAFRSDPESPITDRSPLLHSQYLFDAHFSASGRSAPLARSGSYAGVAQREPEEEVEMEGLSKLGRSLQNAPN